MSSEREGIDQESRTAFEEAGEQQPSSLMKEVWLFIMENKAWWMIPIVLTLSALGLLVVLGSTGAAPFIYTLF